MGCVNPTNNKQNKRKAKALNINDSSKETYIQPIQDINDIIQQQIPNRQLDNSQIEKILQKYLDNLTTSNDQQIEELPPIQQQQYDQLKNLLIFEMLGHKSTHYIPERQCQPNSQLYLKNSDELLWEDQTQLDVELLSLISLRDYGDYISGIWQVSNSQSVEISIIRSHDLGFLREFENDYFDSKRVQQRLKLLHHKTIAYESTNFHYDNNIFRIQQSETFIKMVDFPLMTLHKTIKIRRQANIPYDEEEIIHVILDLLRAVRDADSIGITHGGITDKRIFMSSSGNYKLSGFSEVRIKGLKKQVQKQQTSCFQSRLQSDDDERYEINPSLTLTYSFLKYHAHKFPPRSIIFWKSELSPLFKNAMISYYENKYQDYKMRHEQENYKYLGTEEEKHIKGLLREQDIYSIMVVALQMMTLGNFEKELCLQGSKKSKSGPQFPQVLASLVKSMYAFPIDDHNKEMSDAIRRRKLKKLMHFYLPTQAEISVYMNQYQSQYPRIYNCVNYAQKDLESLIMSIEKGFNPEQPNDQSLFENYVAPNFINDIIKADLERFNAAALKSLDRDKQFSSIREMFYRIQGYMLIRNFRLALQQIDLLTILLDEETSYILPNQLKYFKMQNAMNLFLTDLEEVIVILMQGICQIEMRSLVNAKQTFLRLEGLIQDNQLINSQIIRFYSSLANFYSGNTQDALVSFQRVQEMSNGDLLKQDQVAYFQLSQLLVLNYQDLNDYSQAFRLLKEQLNHHTIIQMKFGYVGSGHITCLFQISKAYFEVSQFELSIKYFNQTLNKLKERENITMLSIKLQTLGYLSHLYFTFNDTVKFLLNLEASLNIIDILLLMEQYLETIIIWLNRFGFLLSNLLKSDRLIQYVDQIMQVITKNENKLNIDLFFKNYVFSKLHFFCLQQKRSQQSFLDTLEMQQYFKSDDLRTPRIEVGLKQKKKQFTLNVQKLDQFRKNQNTGGANLPPPQKDNLTIRILIEIYDWLGYLFKINQEPMKAVSSYQQHQELVSNLIKCNQSQGDVYLLRKAKINFSEQKYSESILMLREISLQKNKQKIDRFLLYQYNLIQAEIQLWIGTIHYILNQDQEANNTYMSAKQQLLRILKSNNESTDIMEVIEVIKFTQTNKSREKIYNKTFEGSLLAENIYVQLQRSVIFNPSATKRI